MDRNDMSRRSVLQYSVAIGAVSACSGCIPGGSKKADVVADPKGGTLRLTETEATKLLEPDSSLLVGLEGDRDKILLIHTSDRLYAVSSKCTHLGCDVGYDSESKHIVCPCHGSQYALDGSTLKGPAKRPLQRYEAKRDQGQVVVTL